MAHEESHGKLSSPSTGPHKNSRQLTTRDAIEQQRAGARVDLCKQKQHEVNCTTQTDFKGYDVLFTAVIL